MGDAGKVPYWIDSGLVRVDFDPLVDSGESGEFGRGNDDFTVDWEFTLAKELVELLNLDVGFGLGNGWANV